MAEPKCIIVVGTSAGGRSALSELVGQLKEDLDAAVFIVMHLSGTIVSDYLARQLEGFTKMPCTVAKDGESIKRGHVYVAAARQHLMVKRGKILLGDGPEENRWRPSIDVLFRSAAATYNTRCIGIVLTGLLDDGTSGMLAIKKSGGICMVQDPNEAEYAAMPLSVLDNMEVEHCVRLSEMGELLYTLSQRDIEEVPAPREVVLESEITERVVIDFESVKQLGEKNIYACPDCGGGLWQIEKGNGKADRYRCHIGHSYSEKDLVVKQAEVLESTLWTALRIMEERRNLLRKMESDNRKKGLSRSADGFLAKGNSLQLHVDRLKEILFDTQKTV